MVTAGNITGTGTINASGLYTNSQLAMMAWRRRRRRKCGDHRGKRSQGITVHADGSNGSTNTGAGAQHGPGGGGGGGFIYSNGALAAPSVNGGAAGTTANANFGGNHLLCRGRRFRYAKSGHYAEPDPNIPDELCVLATAFLSCQPSMKMET